MRDNDDLFHTVQPLMKAALAREVPDIVEPTLVERFLAAIEHQYGPFPPEPPVTGATIRAQCRFCRGRGCLNCDTLAAQEYHRQWPNGPVLLARLRIDDPEDRALFPLLLKGIKDAVTSEEAYNTLDENAALVRAIQQHLAESDRESQP